MNFVFYALVVSVLVACNGVSGSSSTSQPGPTSPSPQDNSPSNPQAGLGNNSHTDMMSIDSSGYENSWERICGIFSGKVICTTDQFEQDYSIIKVPPLNNPSFVAVGNSANACAIDAKRLVCWGPGVSSWEKSDLDKNLKAPIFVALQQSREPRLGVEGAAARGCVIEDNGSLKCWLGSDRPNQQPFLLETPEIQNVKQVSISTSMACAINSKEAKCWKYVQRPGDTYVGYRWRLKAIPALPLSNPREISVGAYSACAIDDSGIKCWGDEVLNPPTVKNPRSLSVGPDRSCVLDDDGIKCWGRGSGYSISDAGLGFQAVHWNAPRAFEKFCGVKNKQYLCVEEKYPGKYRFKVMFPNQSSNLNLKL